MRNNFDSKMTIRPASLMLAGLGAAFLTVAPTPSFAQARVCTVDFSVSNATDLKALQFDVDYAAATASGDFGTDPADCVFADETGLADVLVNTTSDDMTVGWTNTTSFNGPGSFVSCRFDVTGADPVAGNFVVSVVDAAEGPGQPADPMPTMGVSVSCVDAGSCSLTPVTGCRVSTAAGKSSLSFKDDATDDAKDQGKFQWKSGEATVVGDFGDPVGGAATYSWCVYEDGALVRGSDVPAGGTCGTKPCWKAAGTSGFGFKGDVAGIGSIKMKAGADGKAQVQVQGKSKAGNFSSPALPLSGEVLSQFVISSGECFEAEMGTASKNDAASYSAKGVLP